MLEAGEEHAGQVQNDQKQREVRTDLVDLLKNVGREFAAPNAGERASEIRCSIECDAG